MSMLLLLMILNLFLPLSQAITCYLCQSLSSSACDDPFQNSNETCTGEVCVKGKTQTQVDGLFDDVFTLVYIYIYIYVFIYI